MKLHSEVGGSVKNFCRNLNSSPLHSLPNLNSLDEHLIDNVKRQLLISQGEETVEEIFNSLQNLGANWKHLCSRYTTVSSKTQRNPTEIFLRPGILKLP
ncbi:unnamed protein product, partial [Hymenolepis diminuta]